MARTIIDIPEALLREVDSLCALLGISRAEAVRRALREFLRHNADVRTEGFGLWQAAAPEQSTNPSAAGRAGRKR